ncbi:MAG: phosphate propanoyltransferase [Sarcina sp.]
MDKLLIEIIASEVERELKNNKQVKVGVSARHIHLSRKHLEILFGENYKLTPKKMLMAGEFAANEQVSIISRKMKSLDKVRVLGPTRLNTQLEISYTDSKFLKIKAPLRLSGDIKDSEGITIVGPMGCVTIEEGCIIAKRHIHMNEYDYERLGLSTKNVSVKVTGERSGILDNVEIRVGSNYDFEMHIDTDEANALGISTGEFVEIIN